MSSSKEKVRQIQGNLPEREAAVKRAQAALRQREQAVQTAQREMRQAQKAVAKRERAAGIVERQIARNTMPGDGVFQVGVDMKLGLYKTTGAPDCYYAVNSDANGNDIKSNNITSGPANASVSAGEFFESQGCADWVLQQ